MKIPTVRTAKVDNYFIKEITKLMNQYLFLEERSAGNNPVRVGLIGAGKFGSMFVAQARLTKGMQLVGIADLKAQNASDALTKTGWPGDCMTLAASSSSINDLAATGRVALTEDPLELIRSDVDVIIECTGIPEAGVQHALAAMDNRRHIVMVTVEADVLVGPLLYQKPQKAGVLYSMAYGDQPALVCELVDWTRTCGFEVTAAGKATKYLPEYHYSTPETIFEHYGFTKEQVEKGDFNAKMFNSFLDGTKSAIEMAAIANATGLTPQPEGLKFLAVGADDLPKVLKPESGGGILAHNGTVEVVSSLNRDGSAVERDLRWGVYVTFKAATEYAKRCFKEYGGETDESGTYAALYRPLHLIDMELGFSVASVARGESTGASKQFIADVGSVAKQNLNVGDVLDGEGGFTVFGKLISAQTSIKCQALPLGLACGVKVAKPIKKDRLITYKDVELDTNNNLVKLRKQLEETQVEQNN